MAIEDANLPVYRARGTAVAIGVEGNSLHEVAMAVLKVEVKGGRGRVVGCRVDLGWKKARHFEPVVWVARGKTEARERKVDYVGQCVVSQELRKSEGRVRTVPKSAARGRSFLK